MMLPHILAESIDNLIHGLERMLATEQFQYNLRCMNPIAAAMELCTVVVNPGRRMGKTTYIRNSARQGDVIIVPQYRDLRDWQGRTKATVLCAEQLNIRDKTIGLRPYRVYVDEPKLVFATIPEHKLYEAFCITYTYLPLFVMLGRK